LFPRNSRQGNSLAPNFLGSSAFVIFEQLPKEDALPPQLRIFDSDRLLNALVATSPHPAVEKDFAQVSPFRIPSLLVLLSAAAFIKYFESLSSDGGLVLANLQICLITFGFRRSGLKSASLRLLMLFGANGVVWRI
jgi:hypothetical protein